MTRRRWAIAAAILLAVAVSMGRSLGNGFVYDDVAAIATNPRVTAPHWARIPTSTYWQGTLWRPLTTAADAAQWQASGGNPRLFHFVSLIAYAGLGWLLYLLLDRIARQAGWRGAGPATAGVLLFLVHPVHVEVVANVAGQAELWSALALAGALLIYWRARTEASGPLHLIALLAMVFLGIAAKEQGFMIPVVLAGMEWLLLGGRGERWTARIRLLLPAFLLAAPMFVFRASVVGGATGETPALAWRGAGLGARLLTFLAVVPVDLRLLVWPFHLSADYGPPAIPIGGPVTAQHLLGLLIVAGFAAAFVTTIRRAPGVAFGLWCAAATLAPVANVIVPTGIVTAERVLFLPSLGLTIAGMAGAAQVMAKRPEPRSRLVMATIAVGALMVAFVVRGLTRTPVWHDQRAFYTQLTLDAPRSYSAWKISAAYWASVGDTGRATAALRRSWQLWPHDAQVPERLGQIYRAAGRCDLAVSVFEAGIAVDSTATSLRARLVECLIKLRQWDAADRYAAAAPGGFDADRARIARLRAADRAAGPP
ncbi:MAG: hypothetical protein ACREL5_07420 [Gemmatimonadales bacterium]